MGWFKKLINRLKGNKKETQKEPQNMMGNSDYSSSEEEMSKHEAKLRRFDGKRLDEEPKNRDPGDPLTHQEIDLLVSMDPEALKDLGNTLKKPQAAKAAGAFNDAGQQAASRRKKDGRGR